MTWSIPLLHMGKLHAYEHFFVYLLAFGPFLLLGLTIWISRRRAAEHQQQPEESDDPSSDISASQHSPPRD